MKRVLMTILAAMLLVTAATAQSLKFQTFTDSVGVKQKGVPISSQVEVAFPVSGPATLVNALKKAYSERYEIPVSDIKDGKTFYHSISTVVQDYFAQGEACAEIILKKIEEHSTAPTERLIASRFLPGESC